MDGIPSDAQTIGRLISQFLTEYSVPVAKRVGATLLEFAEPDIAEAVVGRRNNQTAPTTAGVEV